MNSWDRVGGTLQPIAGGKPLEGFEQVYNIIIKNLSFTNDHSFVGMRMKRGSRGITIIKAGDDVHCAGC